MGRIGASAMFDMHVSETCQVSPRAKKNSTPFLPSNFHLRYAIDNTRLAIRDLAIHFQPAEVMVDSGAFNDLRFHLQPAEVMIVRDTLGFDDLGFHFGCSFWNLGFSFGSHFSELLTSL